ncbi:hypothetical protein TNCV_2553611 [Trichonephila clavipes]|nr:hypothetical protein TNCV_2553611 [Trichonephila clavipes]
MSSFCAPYTTLNGAADGQLSNVTVRFHPFLPKFWGEHPGGGAFISLSLPPTSLQDLRLDDYLEYPMPQRHNTLTNIHTLSSTRALDLLCSSQRH